MSLASDAAVSSSSIPPVPAVLRRILIYNLASFKSYKLSLAGTVDKIGRFPVLAGLKGTHRCAS